MLVPADVPSEPRDECEAVTAGPQSCCRNVAAYPALRARGIYVMDLRVLLKEEPPVPLRYV